MNLAALLLLTTAFRAETEAPVIRLDSKVTQADVESWRKYLNSEGRDFRLPPVRQQVERIVVLWALDRSFEGATPAMKREVERRHHLWQLERAAHRLRDTMRTEAGPSEAEVRAIFASRPADYAEPAAWVLENVFKRFPERATDEDKARVRRAMEEIRRRALAGEDFQTLARTESDSETRLRGGSLGAPYLRQLAPPVAEVVSKLKAGDISPVFEVPGGLTLLRCVKILEAKEPSFEDARPRIARPLGERRFEQAWTQLDDRLRAELAATLDPQAARGGEAEAVVATFRDGSERRELRRAELDLFLSGRALDSKTLSADGLRERLAERVQLEGLLREAEARGLARQADDASLSRWKTLELRAQVLEDALPVPDVTEAEERAAFEARRADFVMAPRWHLQALRLRISPENPRDFYERARVWGERLSAGAAGFDAAARELSPPAERLDLGWLDADQLWQMGLNVDTAVKATPAGRATRLVQEGKDLYIVHVLARESERQPSFEEARERVRRVLRDEARQRAVAELHRRLLAGINLVPAQ